MKTGWHQFKPPANRGATQWLNYHYGVFGINVRRLYRGHYFTNMIIMVHLAMMVSAKHTFIGSIRALLLKLLPVSTETEAKQ